jgi:hypothetical protein
MGVAQTGFWAVAQQNELFSAFLTHVLPIWLFGALVGLLLPRPKSWTGGRITLLMASPVLSKGLLVCQGALILREVWTHCTHPGTFRGLARATVQWISGNGWTFTWPAHAAGALGSSSGCSKGAGGGDAAAAAAAGEGDMAASQERMDNWYVGEKDLAFFKYHAVEGGPCEGASPWQLMMTKDMPGFVRYQSWRRSLPDGKTEYKSVTISPNATAREFADMYLDDDFRRNWDGMVYHHEVLEHGDFSQRQQVVRWIRRFPFAFLSDREYTIARREVTEADGAIYGITKALAGHPREYLDSNVVKMDVFWSMWRSRTVADPWGADSPACETVLLHHEQFKIPENLARFAVKHGMWSFVRKLASTVPVYVEARRKRVAPTEDDPQAYGAGAEPNPPTCSSGSGSSHLRHSDSAASLSAALSRGRSGRWAGSSGSSECGSEDSAHPGQGHVQRAGSSGGRRVRNAAVLLVASGIALAVKAHSSGSSSSSALRPAGAGKRLQQQRRHQRRALASHVLAEVPEVLDE